MELGAADDLVFQDVNSKQKGGAVAKFTNGAIDRASYYEHALHCALVPFLAPCDKLFQDDKSVRSGADMGEIDGEPPSKRVKATL